MRLRLLLALAALVALPSVAAAQTDTDGTRPAAFLVPMPRDAGFRIPNARSYVEMEPSTRRLLNDAFRDSNARLAELLGREPGWPS